MKKKEQLGNDHYQLIQVAKFIKSRMNEDKLALGSVLLKLQDFHRNCEIEGIEDFGTFNSNLAELHLNKRRVITMLKIAAYAKEMEVKEDDYKYFDSAIMDVLRKNQKDPYKYLHHIQAGVSYSDLIELVKNK